MKNHIQSTLCNVGILQLSNRTELQRKDSGACEGCVQSSFSWYIFEEVVHSSEEFHNIPIGRIHRFLKGSMHHLDTTGSYI